MPFKKKKQPSKKKVPKSVKQYVKKQIIKTSEERQFTVQNGVIEATTAAEMEDLTLIDIAPTTAVDDPEFYRSSDRIKPLKLVVSGYLGPKATSTVDTYLRLIFFQWKEDLPASAPTSTDLLGNNNVYPYLSLAKQDIDCNKNARILYDKLFHWGPYAQQVKKTTPFRKIINLKKLPSIQYTSTAGTTGKNHIYMMILGNTATGDMSSVCNLDTMLIYLNQ